MNDSLNNVLIIFLFILFIRSFKKTVQIYGNSLLMSYVSKNSFWELKSTCHIKLKWIFNWNLNNIYHINYFISFIYINDFPWFIQKKGKLEQSIIEIEKTIKSEIDPYHTFWKIYILGPTGSGKSSLLCCLINKYIQVVLGKGKKALLKGEGIGFGGKSFTKMPNIQVDLNNELIFCDCPGFKDTEGLEQEIINSFAIDYLFSTEGSNNQIKIVLVVSVYDLMATRQVHFLETLEQLNEMFPRINEMKKYIDLIITKEDEEVGVIDLLEQIEENASHEMKIWIDYFRRNEHQVFTFPKAKISDVNNKYDFEDHDKLLHFLLCNYIRDPEHKIALSSQAFDRLEILKESQIKKIKEIISDFFSKLYDECDKCTDCESIELYINQIQILRIQEIF